MLLPVDAVISDCDGTLSTIEGIDELARMNDVYAEISQLTQAAMTQGIAEKNASNLNGDF